jgi:hypothetical protein
MSRARSCPAAPDDDSCARGRMAASMVGHQPLLCLVHCRALRSVRPGAVDTLSYACINPFDPAHA